MSEFGMLTIFSSYKPAIAMRLNRTATYRFLFLIYWHFLILQESNSSPADELFTYTIRKQVTNKNMKERISGK